MTYEECEELLRDWAETVLKEFDTGLPPVPMKLDVNMRQGVPLGSYVGDEGPKSESRLMSVDLMFSFTRETPEERVAAIAETLVTAAEEDPSMDGRLGTGRLLHEKPKIEPGAGSYGDESTLLTVPLLLTSVA